MPGSLVVQAGPELARAHEVEVVVATEPVDLLAERTRGLEVDRDEVAVLDGSLGGLELGETFAQPVDPFVDLGVG